MKISYFSDYACPYCFIGETNLKHALEKVGLEETPVHMYAFELDPNAPKKSSGTTVERFSNKYGITEEEAAERIKSISEMASEAGIGFDYASANYSNTFDAHRLTKLAQSIDAKTADKLSEILYRTYFIDQKELADFDTLLACAVEAGIDEDLAREVLEGDKFSNEVRSEEMMAQRLGVNAVPFIIIDDKYAIPGAYPVDGIVKVLEEVVKP